MLIYTTSKLLLSYRTAACQFLICILMKPIKGKVSAISLIILPRKSKNKNPILHLSYNSKTSNEMPPEMPTGMSFMLPLAIRIACQPQSQGKKRRRRNVRETQWYRLGVYKLFSVNGQTKYIHFAGNSFSITTYSTRAITIYKGINVVLFQ